jgi:hypothetical protein
MERLILSLALASAALSGCAQLTDASAEAGATATEQQRRPYPNVYRNDHYYVP